MLNTCLNVRLDGDEHNMNVPTRENVTQMVVEINRNRSGMLSFGLVLQSSR